jgi:hypothetical protein
METLVGTKEKIPFLNLVLSFRIFNCINYQLLKRYEGLFG